MPAPLPPEIWWKILLESVVEMALQSDSPASLNKSLTQHALVCRHWASCVDDPIFRRQAKRLLCRHEPWRRYRSSAQVVHSRGIDNIAAVDVMTMLDKHLYASCSRDQILCYNTESYNDKRKSLIFHHVKTLTLFGDVLPFGPQVMVGCQSTRRLFILDSGLGPNSTIYRINADSGEVEMAWLVDGMSRAMTVAGKNHLLLTTHDRLKLYDTDGKFIRDVPTPVLPMEEEMHESLLLPDGLTYAVCCSELLENDHHLVFINGANTFRIVPGASHVPLGVRGYTADSRGCVLLFEEHWLDISLRMLHFGPTSMTSRYLLYNTDDVGMRDMWKEMWVDEDRGLLFVWTPGRCVSVFQVYDSEL